MSQSRLSLSLVFVAATSVLGQMHGQQNVDALKTGFQNPPASARPRVWWHWMNGNITKQGIKLDLDWMNRVGIAGFQNFDATLQTPQVVDKRLIYMTPEWKDAFRYAIHLGDKFGMEMAIAGSPGWSESGGPWVPPSHGMKKYVWSETLVSGGAPFLGVLAHPPTVTGHFQNLGDVAYTGPEFYRDAAVVAFPISTPSTVERPEVTTSDPQIDATIVNDGDLTRTTPIAVPALGKEAWIQFAFHTRHDVRAVRYVIHGPRPLMTLQASEDGKVFRTISPLSDGSAPEETVTVPAATARYFRVTFRKSAKTPASLKSFNLAELSLESEPRINRFEEKAAFVPAGDLYASPTPDVGAAESVHADTVVNLTSRLRPDGTLDWTPPAGSWMVLRFGYSLLGTLNHPATAEATGLEVDKLNHIYVRDYLEKYLASYQDAVGAGEMGKSGIGFMINDSWEAGSQNWTDDMIADFKKLRGYDPVPWMPVLAGRVVNNAADSDRFLWDFRKTIADLIADEHYGELEKVLHEHHMGHYGESHEVHRAFDADGMEVKKFNEVPMGAMWTQVPGLNRPTYGFDADDRESASVAHIYGQNIAAAESLTAGKAAWAWSPSSLKPTADEELLNGINRFMIHESTHQPLVGPAPGLSLGHFGQWFNRNETWAEQAGAWIDYLGRSSFLLQQGRFSADILYFYGEDDNLTDLFSDKAPDIPAGYAYDYTNADALEHELQVDGGNIATKSGMRYRLLALDPNSKHMSLPVLQSIAHLVENGAIVVGAKPSDDPSLADDRVAFQQLDDALFGDGTTAQSIGKGVVYAGLDIQQVLNLMGLQADFEALHEDVDGPIEFVHRKLDSGDIYFLDNRSDHATSFLAEFRVAGYAPELWRAENGEIVPTSYASADGRTNVPLRLEPWGTIFVVFRKAAEKPSLDLPETITTQIATIRGPWSLSFQSGRGAPASTQLPELIDWRDSSNPGIKYFSGAGTYEKLISVDPRWLVPGQKIWLNLGSVGHLAVVTVNGKNVSQVWHAPYRIEVTSFVHLGDNAISIEVVNSWVNRLVGDQQPGAQQYTFTTSKPYGPTSPLEPSGLLGPVTLEGEQKQ